MIQYSYLLIAVIESPLSISVAFIPNRSLIVQKNKISSQLHVYNEMGRSENCTEEAEELRSKLDNANKIIAKLKESLKIDRLAYEGQVKKTRVLEHDINELKLLIDTEVKEAEQRVEVVTVSFQKERALRLKKINQCRDFQRKAVDASNERSIIKEALLSELKKSEVLRRESLKLKTRCDAQEQIITECDKEFKEHVREIGKLNVQIIQLKKKVNDSNKARQHHMDLSEKLKRECQRLRTMLTQTASSRKKQRENSQVSKTLQYSSLNVESVETSKARCDSNIIKKGTLRGDTDKNSDNLYNIADAISPNNSCVTPIVKESQSNLRREIDNFKSMIEHITSAL